jgi:hypothetical protein
MLFKKNHSDKENFIQRFVEAITMSGKSEGRPPTEADFLAYCAENLMDSLSSIPTAESMHPKELNRHQGQQVTGLVAKQLTSTNRRRRSSTVSDSALLAFQNCGLHGNGSLCYHARGCRWHTLQR